MFKHVYIYIINVCIYTYIAIKDFKNRLCGSTFTTMIFNKIEDDINVYIDYIMKLNSVISNILETHSECCPMQIDVVLIGKEHKEREKKEDDANQDEEEENGAKHSKEKPRIEKKAGNAKQDVEVEGEEDDDEDDDDDDVDGGIMHDINESTQMRMLLPSHRRYVFY